MNAQPRHAYGVEFASGRVTVVRVDRSGRKGTPEMLASGMDTVSDATWPELAAKMMRDQDRGAAVIVASASATDSFMRPVEAPFASISKARAVFPSLLDVQLPFPLEQCAWTFVGVSKTAGRQVRAIAVAAPMEKLAAQLDALRTCGIDPEWLSHEALSLWSCARRSYPSANGSVQVMVYLGADRTVAVVGDEREPLAATGIRMAWSAGADDASREKLLLRLRQFLAGALRNTGEKSVTYLAAGPGAGTDGGRLQTALGIDVQRWRIAERPDTFLAGALAESAIFAREWSGNLRLGGLAHANTEHRRQRLLNRACLSVAVASLVLMAGAWLSLRLAADYHAKLQRANRSSAQAITGMPFVPPGQEVFLVGLHADEAAETYREFQTWLEPSAYMDFARLLRLAAARGTAVETIAIRPGSLLIRGAGRDWNDPDHLTRHLSQEGWKVDIERSDAGADERIHFVVRAQQ